MIYNTYIPQKLNGLIDLVWEMQIHGPTRYIILPSGKVELLFPLYSQVEIDAYKIGALENPVRNCTSFLSGLHTKPLKMRFDRFHVFGIQMKPIAVYALFGLPLSEIRNFFVDGHHILNDIDMMEDRLNEKSSFLERAKWFESFLLKRIQETPDLHMAIKLEHSVNKFMQQGMPSHKKSIQDILGYSRTQTYRIFNTWFGTSAYSYQKLVQFIRSVETLHNPNLQLKDVAYSNGYFDQSHFIRNFQDFAEITPGTYRKQLSSQPGTIFL